MRQFTVLDNGVRVVSEYVPWATSVSIGFWLDRGSRDEGLDEAGYAHMVEHMLFKGTATRSARDIAEIIDRTGGQMNAFTTKETTCYHCRVLAADMPVAMELLADMLLHSTFHGEELARERAVILEEINQIQDAPEELIHDLFDEGLFGEHPLAGPVLGTGASVAAAERDDLLAFVAKHYRPEHLVVALAGRVCHDEAVAAADKWLGPWRADDGPGSVRRPTPLRHRPQRKVLERDGEQVHLCVGGPGLPRLHPDRYALDVLDGLVGGSVGSRLFQRLREEKGLVYSTYSFSADYFDAGVFGCYAATGPDRVEEVLDVIFHELGRAAEGDVDEGEVERAKDQIKRSVLLGWESTSTRMGMLAGAELAGEPYLDAHSLAVRYDSVTVDDVRRVAARLLAPDELSVLLLGPVQRAGKTNKLAEAIG